MEQNERLTSEWHRKLRPQQAATAGANPVAEAAVAVAGVAVVAAEKVVGAPEDVEHGRRPALWLEKKVATAAEVAGAVAGVAVEGVVGATEMVAEAAVVEVEGEAEAAAEAEAGAVSASSGCIAGPSVSVLLTSTQCRPRTLHNCTHLRATHCIH